MIGGGGRRGGRIWSFEWGLTLDSISESMHSELQTHPQWRGRAKVGLRHLTLGGDLASHQGFPNIGDNIAIAIKTSGFHSLFFCRTWRRYIFIGEEGNGKGYLGIPKVPLHLRLS